MNGCNLHAQDKPQCLFRIIYEKVCDLRALFAAPERQGVGPFSFLGCSPAEKRLLLCICIHDGISVKDLAAMEGITPSAVSQTVKRLEKRGCIIKTQCLTNHKKYHIRPTELGLNMCREIVKRDSENVERFKLYLSSHFSEDELTSFLKVLTGVCDYASRRSASEKSNHGSGGE